MSDIQTLVTWCEQARAILKVTGGKKGRAALKLDKQLQSVAGLLRELTALAGESASVKRLYAEFERIASAALALGDNPKLLKLAPDALREKAKGVTQSLEKLAKQLTSAKPAAQKVADYRKRMELCLSERRSFETEPYADVTDLSNVINEAVLGEQALDDPTLVDKALKVLDGFEAAKKLARQKQQKGSQLAQEQLKMEGVCRDRLRDCRQALVFAQATLGVEAEAALLETALRRADKLVQGGRWKDALDLLDGKSDLPPLPTLDKVRKLASDQFDKQPEQARKAMEALLKYKALVDPMEHAELQTKVLDTVRSAPQYTRQSGIKLLDGALQLVTTKLDAATRMKADAEKLMQQADQALRDGKSSLSIEQHQTLADELDRLKTDLAQRRLLRAIETAAPLLARIKQAVLDAGSAGKQWTGIEAEFGKRVQALQFHANDKAAPSEARERCRRLAGSVSGQRDTLVQGREWDTLVALHQDMHDEIQAFAKANGAYEKFADERRDGNTAVQDELGATRLLFEQAQSALASEEGINADKVLAPLRKELELISSTWDSKLANAAGTDALGLKDTLGALGKLAEKLKAATKPEAISSTRDSQADEAAQASFNHGVQQLEATHLAELRRTDTATGETLRERMDKLAADSKQSWAARVKLLEALGLEMKGACEKATTDQLNRTSQLQTRCDELKRLLGIEHDKLKSTNDKAFEPLFLDLGSRLEDQRALAETPNAGAAGAVTKALDVIQRQINDIATGSVSGSSFKDVREKLAALEKDIDKASADLKSNVPKTLATLRKLVLDLKTEMLGLTPEAARGEILALATSLRNALAEARDVSALRSSFATLKPVVESKIKALDELKTVPAFVKMATQRLAVLDKQAKASDKLLTSKQQLDVLNKDVEAAYIDPAKGLQMQGKLQADEERKRLQEVECKALLAHLRKAGLQRVDQAIKDGDGDPALKAEIKRMLDDTQTVVKGGDFSDGLRKLQLVQQRIDEVVANPQGAGIGGRGALPKDAGLYSNSADKLLADLEALPKMVAEKLATLPDAVMKKIEQQLATLTRRVNPALFDAHASVLADKAVPVRERRAAREAALLALRNLRGLLSEHPQFAALWANPFHVALKLDKTEVDQRLLRLEANIRRSVH